MLFQTSLGVDIQDKMLALTCLKGSSREVHLVAHAAYTVSEETGEKKSDAVNTLIQSFIRNNRISPSTLFISLPRSAAIIRYLDLPLAVKENLRQTLGYEMEKFVPLAREDIYFDYQIIHENKESNQLKVFLVVVKKETLDPYLKLSGQLGPGISGIEIECIISHFDFVYRGTGDLLR